MNENIEVGIDEVGRGSIFGPIFSAVVVLSNKNGLKLKKLGLDYCRIEGYESNDWKLVDAIDVIVHLFHPEKRAFYDLEKMWSEDLPKEKALI